MKKIAILIVLFLSASAAMAQFGNLKDVIKQEGHGRDTTSNNVGVPEAKVQESFALMEEALKDALFCIKQDFQLEDTTTGKHYNYADDPKRFGGQTSFMVSFDDGFIVPDEVLYPWDYDENYPEYRNSKYKPFVNRSSLLKVGQKTWASDRKFEFWEERWITDGLKYAKVEEPVDKGLKWASGYGKKEVLVVWLLLLEGDTDSETKCEFFTQKTELTIEKDNKLYKIEQPNAKLPVLGGIVVEPVVGGLGTIDLALVGVVKKYDDEYKMALVIQHEKNADSGALKPED